MVVGIVDGATHRPGGSVGSCDHQGKGVLLTLFWEWKSGNYNPKSTFNHNALYIVILQVVNIGLLSIAVVIHVVAAIVFDPEGGWAREFIYIRNQFVGVVFLASCVQVN